MSLRDLYTNVLLLATLLLATLKGRHEKKCNYNVYMAYYSLILLLCSFINEQRSRKNEEGGDDGLYNYML